MIALAHIARLQRPIVRPARPPCLRGWLLRLAPWPRRGAHADDTSRTNTKAVQPVTESATHSRLPLGCLKENVARCQKVATFWRPLPRRKAQTFWPEAPALTRIAAVRRRTRVCSSKARTCLGGCVSVAAPSCQRVGRLVGQVTRNCCKYHILFIRQKPYGSICLHDGVRL